MNKPIGQEALKPNPALKPFEVLLGEWATEGTHPYLPGRTLRGRSSFQWIEGGAFLMWRSDMDAPEVPDGMAIIGSDDATGECFMLYFDSRGVSRKMQTKMQDGTWTWWRDDPKFRQRYTSTFTDGGRTMLTRGEMCRDGGAWEPDLQLTSRRS